MTVNRDALRELVMNVTGKGPGAADDYIHIAEAAYHMALEDHDAPVNDQERENIYSEGYGDGYDRGFEDGLNDHYDSYAAYSLARQVSHDV